MVFYGPSGVGKTTVASIIAKQSHMHLCKLNGTTASTADIRDVVAQVNTLQAVNGVLLYLDEIQYFNKKQQQTLLEFIENGSITLIASTTENPYFYVYNAILSRSTVFEFKPVEKEEVARAVDRAFRILSEDLGEEIRLEDGVTSYIASACGGDVRKAMNAAELCTAAVRSEDEPRITMELAEQLHSAVPCGMTETATRITIFFRRFKNPCAAPTPTQRCIISHGFWKRATSPLHAAA